MAFGGHPCGVLVQTLGKLWLLYSARNKEAFCKRLSRNYSFADKQERTVGHSKVV